MGDMWDALEKQERKRESLSSGDTQKLSTASPTMLATVARQYFREADFSSSGKIDDDEALEVVQKVAVHGGFTLPPHDKLNALFARCALSQKHFINVNEFITFVKHVAFGTEPDAPAPAPAPAAAPAAPAPAPARPAPVATPSPTPPSTVSTPAPPAPQAPSGDASHGRLRVCVLEVEGVSTRADGSARAPYATVAVTELTRRRTRRTSTWGEAFDFEGTSAGALVVVDVWDPPTGGSPAELLGKAAVSVEDCRPGVAHLSLSKLLDGGQLALQVLFDEDRI